MKGNTILIMTLLLFFIGCGNNKKTSVRDDAISLIEKSYPINGSRNIEYSQVDSTEASLKGYYILRLYISDNDSIKIEQFHLNYNRTKVNIVGYKDIYPNMYKRLLNDNGRVFTDSLVKDAYRIESVTSPDMKEMRRYADSLRISDSISIY